MFKVSGGYNYLDNAFNSIMKGYDRVEPDFIQKAREVKDAPIDKFIKYGKEALENSRAKKFKNFIYNIFSYIKNI